MSDIDHEDDFEKAFEGFGEDEKPTPQADPPKDDPVQEDGGKDDTEPKDAKDDKQPPADPQKEENTSPSGDEKKEEDGGEAPKDPETPTKPEQPEAPQPLTKDDLKTVINDLRTEERTSTQALQAATNEVLEAYYPEGLSNTLIDQNTGKELKTPQDVVEVTNGQMSIEEATKWLMNEQFKLDKELDTIKKDAEKIAETTLKFRQDGETVLKRYEPLFKAYPQLQQKVWDTYSPLVKADKDKNVILSAPDMDKFYDAFLEPYRMAFELGQQQPATQPTSQPEATPPAPTPSADDRLDEGGDGGATPPDDPNDFAQQVKKELAKGI